MPSISQNSPVCSPIANVLGRLNAVHRTSGSKHMARCPAHDDGRPSLSVCEGNDRRVLLKCFAGCGVADITAAIGLSLSDLYPPSTPEQRQTARRRASRQQALEEIGREATIVQVIATDVKESQAIDPETWGRLAEAARRIRAARERLS